MSRSYLRARQLWREYDLNRKLHWGWDFAHYFARNRLRAYEEHDGFWVCEAIRLARDLKLTGDETDLALRRKHRRSYHAIREAHDIWQANTMQRWAIEARILARRTDEQIARIEHLEADAIAAFQALFFNVRDRLKRRAWIYTMVLDFDRDWTGQDVANVWAFFGFNAREIVLQAVIDDFVASGKPDYQHLCCKWFTDFPPECTQRFLWWNIQSLLLPRVLTKTQARKMIELNQRVIASKQFGSTTQTIEPPDLQLPAASDLGAIWTPAQTG